MLRARRAGPGTAAVRLTHRACRSSDLPAATRDQITHTWVGGRCLMDNRQLTTLNEALILNNAQQWQEKIAGADRD